MMEARKLAVDEVGARKESEGAMDEVYKVCQKYGKDYKKRNAPRKQKLPMVRQMLQRL